jgi:hypothetical protein
MNEYLKKQLVDYAKKLIKEEVPPSEYYKEDLINEINTYGIDYYSDISEDGDWKLIDELQSQIDDTIRNWCRYYEKEFDKDTILEMPLQKLSRTDRHTYLNIVPDDFPECQDIKTDHFLRLIKMQVKDFIKLSFDEICKLPLCSQQLKEEKKEERYLKVLEYQTNIINYINNLEEEVE